VVVRFDPATAATRGASIELAEGWRDFRAGTVIDGAAPCVSAPPDFVNETGIFDLRGAGRHEQRANRAAVRTVVTAYDSRGAVMTRMETGERGMGNGEPVTSWGLRGGVPVEAEEEERPNAVRPSNLAAEVAAIEAEERLMAYA
jgi:hypothetical protein